VAWYEVIGQTYKPAAVTIFTLEVSHTGKQIGYTRQERQVSHGEQEDW
jgi:hypothetical protein